ncbi:C-type mannose receptor 2-like [Eriocheir sinensis]|uniref:C-type mannose receptor 2-like n=1 Tax=Eriocheir sinensis TaxID=95602 RepID=UPI0021C622AE|nr:C-type mannose receptor 2-like [Eriocheir sinensis]
MAATSALLLLVLCAVDAQGFKQLTDGQGRERCAEEGRFAHPDYCDEYIDCVRQGEGNVLQAYVGSCRGGVFDPDLKKCLPSTKHNSSCKAHRRQGKMTPMEHNHDFACNQIQNGFSCLSCNTLVICVDGKAHTEECRTDFACDVREPYKGAVCYPKSPAQCTCGNTKQLLPDPYNPQAYLECMSGAKEPTVRFCRKGMFFSRENLMCQYPGNNVQCSNQGTFPNPNDCTEYYKCIQTTGGFIQYTFQCTCGFLFNEITGSCEDPCSYQPEEFKCKTEGRFPNQYDCSSYYVCVADNILQTGFIQELRRCPLGLTWTAGSVAGTGQCMPGNSAICTSYRVPRCAVPKGRSCAATPTVTKGGSCRQGSPNCQCNSATGQLSCGKNFVAVGDSCSQCEEGWTLYKSSCYYFNVERKGTWDESRSYCADFKSDLVKITSAEEEHFIRERMDGSVWIGLNDIKEEGRFEWTDGSRPTYTGWSPNEPNDSGGAEDCTTLRKSEGWNDIICSSKFG